MICDKTLMASVRRDNPYDLPRRVTTTARPDRFPLCRRFGNFFKALLRKSI